MRAVLLLVLTLGGLGAAEQALSELRLEAEARPTAWDFTLADDHTTRSGHDQFDHAWAAGPALRWGWGRPGRPQHLLLGLAALWVDEAVAEGGRRGVLARVEAGYAHGLDDRWTLTLLPGAGIGRAAFRLPGPAGGARLDGTMLEAGLRAGLRWNPGGRWTLGAEAGWLIGRDRHRGGGLSLDVERSGAWAGISLGWLLDAATRRLE